MDEIKNIKISKNAAEALQIARNILNDPDRSKPELEVAPGEAAMKICPDILREISKGICSIVVTGTNGKTTVVRMIASILQEAGIEYIANIEGANMENRITGLYCENFDPDAGPKKRTAVVECDEGYLRLVMPKLNPLCLVITCIYPDQLERFHSENHVADLICQAMERTKPAVCILSENCHFSERLHKIPGWDFVDSCALQEEDKKQELRPGIPGAFNLENAFAAACVGRFLGISDENIRKGIEKTQPAFGRFEIFEYGKSRVTICLAKNNAGFETVSEWYCSLETKEKRQVILAMNNNTGDDKNPEWLRNNNYGKMADRAVNILVTGICADIVINTMKDNGITSVPCRMESIPELIAGFDGETVVIANYTAMMQIRELFVDLGKLRPYWEV